MGKYGVVVKYCLGQSMTIIHGQLESIAICNILAVLSIFPFFCFFILFYVYAHVYIVITEECYPNCTFGDVTDSLLYSPVCHMSVFELPLSRMSLIIIVIQMLNKTACKWKDTPPHIIIIIIIF